MTPRAQSEQKKCSSLCTGKASGSSRGHGEDAAQPWRGSAEWEAAGELPAAHLKAEYRYVCTRLPDCCLLTFLSPSAHAGIIHNPLSGQTLPLSNWLVISGEFRCMNTKLVELFLISTSPSCCFPAPVLKLGNPKIVTPFPWPCFAPFLTTPISSMVLHSASK